MASARDTEREASYPETARRAIDRFVKARMAARAPGGPLWRQLYENLDRDLEGTVVALEEGAAEYEAKLPQVRAQERQARAEKVWESQALEVDPHLSRREQRRRYAGRDVWMYHGTSSAVLETILQHGLVPYPERFNERERRAHYLGDKPTTPGYVYLTTEHGADGQGGTAAWYALMATKLFGGDPVILRVIVAWDDLEPDADDEDLSCGRYQFRTSEPVTRILEVAGQRQRRGRR